MKGAHLGPIPRLLICLMLGASHGDRQHSSSMELMLHCNYLISDVFITFTSI